MLELVDDRQTQLEGRRILRETFRRNAENPPLIHTFTSPGGSYENAEVFIRKDLGIYGSIGSGLRGKSILGFGVGHPGSTIGVELKVPQGRSVGNNGQFVKHKDGSIYIGHQGGLGGGKYSMSRARFASLIKGFHRTPVQDGETLRDMFVLAKIDCLKDMEVLARFVKEAKRLKEIRIKEVVEGRSEGELGTEDGKKQDGFENDEGGVYTRSQRVEFERRHSLVQNALQRWMEAHNYKTHKTRLSHGLRADLESRKPGSSFLFEIKASCGAQTHFRAIGQLLVYEKGLKLRPKKLMVIPDVVRSPLMKSTLKQLEIGIVQYAIVNENVIFDDLDTALGLADG